MQPNSYGRVSANRFIKACNDGVLNRVQRMYAQGVRCTSYYPFWHGYYKACENNHLPIVQFLLDNGLDLRLDRGSSDMRGIDIAVSKGYLPIVELICNRFYDLDIYSPNNQDNSILHRAILVGLPIFEFLCTHYQDTRQFHIVMTDKNNSLLRYAIRVYNLEILHFIISSPVFINFKKYIHSNALEFLITSSRHTTRTRLYEMIQLGYTIREHDIIADRPLLIYALIFIDYAPDIAVDLYINKTRSARDVFYNIYYSYNEIVPNLVHLWLKIYQSGWYNEDDYLFPTSLCDIRVENNQTIFHRACINGNFEFIQGCCMLDIEVTKMVDDLGNTGLHYACMKGYIDIMNQCTYHLDSLFILNNDEKIPFELISEELLEYVFPRIYLLCKDYRVIPIFRYTDQDCIVAKDVIAEGKKYKICIKEHPVLLCYWRTYRLNTKCMYCCQPMDTNIYIQSVLID